MAIHAVIDTNVIVASLLTSDTDSPTIGVIRSISNGELIPIYSEYLFREYYEVLTRSKFRIPSGLRDGIMAMFVTKGLCFEPRRITMDMPDPDDVPIFLIAEQTRDLETYLVTGNSKHYPIVDYVVSPKRMMEILEGRKS